MSIVTKTGDSGQTGLATGERVSKSDLRMEACGTLDELVSFLGLARSADIDKTIALHVKNIQCHLFLLGTEFAGGNKFAEPCECCKGSSRTHEPQGITEAHLKEVEALINEHESHLGEIKGFVIPGGSMPSALMDVARAVCRRLERRMVALREAGHLENEFALKYINRVADLLYIFARHL